MSSTAPRHLEWRPTDDLLEHTRENVDTLIRLGDCVALSGF